jgi:hypothetical protein
LPGESTVRPAKRPREDDVVDVEGSDDGDDDDESSRSDEDDDASENGDEDSDEGDNPEASEDGGEKRESFWRPPTEDEAEDMMLFAFVDCLQVLMGRVGTQWARSAIEALFTTTYHERSRIPEPLRTKVENWQADLKRGVKSVSYDMANSILESKHKVVDGREDKMMVNGANQVWASKQFGFEAER